MLTPIEPEWLPIQQMPAEIAGNLQLWIAMQTSLTEQLRKLGAFQVKVLQEYWGNATTAENHALSIPDSEKSWQRDVVLLLNGVPVIVAHSLIPLSMVEDPTLELKQLGTRSLGEIIFTELHGARELLEYANLTAEHYLFILAKPFIEKQNKNLYARRSIIKVKQHQLLINEVFLPSIEVCKPC